MVALEQERRELLIVGEIEFPSDNDAFSDATLNVTIQDVREADAPSQVLCKEVRRNVSRVQGGGESLRFAIECEGIPENLFVTVNVLVDLDGDGRISKGDYVNTESYPVQFFPREMRIRVQRVK